MRSTAPNTRARARPSREVMKIGDFSITLRAKKLDAAISLIVAMLNEQPTARPEAEVRVRGNRPDAGEPVLAADQGEARFEAHVASVQMDLSRRDVRRICLDRVERLPSVAPCAANPASPWSAARTGSPASGRLPRTRTSGSGRAVGCSWSMATIREIAASSFFARRVMLKSPIFMTSRDGRARARVFGAVDRIQNERYNSRRFLSGI